MEKRQSRSILRPPPLARQANLVFGQRRHPFQRLYVLRRLHYSENSGLFPPRNSKGNCRWQFLCVQRQEGQPAPRIFDFLCGTGWPSSGATLPGTYTSTSAPALILQNGRTAINASTRKRTIRSATQSKRYQRERNTLK